MILNSIPQTPNLVLCTLQKAFSKKQNKQKNRRRKRGKKSDYFTQTEKM